MKRIKKSISIFTIMIMTMGLLMGCATSTEEENDNAMAENVVLTETGEVLVLPQPEDVPAEEQVEVKQEELSLTGQPEGEQVMISPEEVDAPVEESELSIEEAPEAGSGLQLVFLGDSIFDGHRDGTGVPYLTAVQCDANLYNLAIGGTSATVDKYDQLGDDKWESKSLVGIVKAMKGDISTDIFEGTNAKAVLDNPNVDFSKTDYFIVEYGINDFFEGVPLGVPEDGMFDFTTYVGALRYAVVTLREIAPDATIILCGPHFCQFFKDNKYIGDSNTVNTGYGTLFDYKGICQYLANEQKTEFLDAYFDIGINGYTAQDLLADGVHLSDEGRQNYADVLAKKILKIEETKNN